MHVQTNSKYNRLPYDILKAIDKAMHLIDIKRCVKITLAEICRHVSLTDPNKPIYASKETIADLINVNARTVFRHIAYLEASGFITTTKQQRLKGSGWFCNGEIHITKKTQLLLELDQASLSTKKDSKDDKPSDKLSCAKSTGLKDTKGQSSYPHLINGLPAALAWLTEKKLTRGGLCKLMGLATKNGKRLEDIMTIEEKTVCALSGGILYGFFIKRIYNDIDYAFLVKQKVVITEKETQILKIKAKEAELRDRFKGKTFATITGDTVIHMDYHTQSAVISKHGSKTTMPKADVIQIESMLNAKDIIEITEDELIALNLQCTTINSSNATNSTRNHQQDLDLNLKRTKKKSFVVKIINEGNHVEKTHIFNELKLRKDIEHLPNGYNANIAMMKNILFGRSA